MSTEFGIVMEASPGYTARLAQQIEALVELCRAILGRHPAIEPRNVVGHSDIAPQRKIDPGRRFPWKILAEQEIGSFYLTDFLLRHFERLIMHGLGIDKHPQLLPVYFGNYTTLMYLCQKESPEGMALGQAAAKRLGLAFAYRVTGYGEMETELKTVSEKVIQWQN